ncbi:MAG: hypothetical protein ACRELC_01190 [Gemmatimonadota bacterium]
MSRPSAGALALTFALPLGVGIAARNAPGAGASGRAAPPRPQCTASLVPSEVAVYERPIPVFASLSEPIGSGVEASAPSESGIAVQSTEPGDTETSVVVVLDTSDANAGEWTLRFVGDGGECAGTITVREPPTPGRGARAARPSPPDPDAGSGRQ